jgi:hypothetical protein
LRLNDESWCLLQGLTAAYKHEFEIGETPYCSKLASVSMDRIQSLVSFARVCTVRLLQLGEDSSLENQSTLPNV